METYNKVALIGEKKCKQNPKKQFLSAILSGVYLSFGGACSMRIGGELPNLDIGLSRLLSGLFGLPIGLMLIVICQTQLFTGNTAFFTCALYEKKITYLNAFKSLLIIYLGNLIGSLLFAGLIYETDILSNSTSILKLTETKLSYNWGNVLLRGILCNWFVCLALWEAVAANNIMGKAIGLYPTILGFVALGLEHSIANMYFIPQGLMLGANNTVLDFIIKNLIPVTLGNIISGVLLVGITSGLMYHQPTI